MPLIVGDGDEASCGSVRSVCSSFLFGLDDVGSAVGNAGRWFGPSAASLAALVLSGVDAAAVVLASTNLTGCVWSALPSLRGGGP